MASQQRIDAVVCQFVVDILIIHQIEIVILVLVCVIGGDVRIDRVVPRFINDPSTVLQRLQSTLFASPIIHAGSNDVPTTIDVGKVTTENRSGCCQCQLHMDIEQVSSPVCPIHCFLP